MNSRVRFGTAALALTAIISVAACSDDSSDAIPTTAPATTAGEPTTTIQATTTVPVVDIVATALINHQFTTLAGMVADAGLIETLRTPGPFTVFAPVDAAFAKVPTELLTAVQGDPKLLATVLTYHVAPGTFTTADLLEIADTTGKLDTVAGVQLTITRDGDKPLINGFAIAVADIPATNGIIHAMGDVLVPPS